MKEIIKQDFSDIDALGLELLPDYLLKKPTPKMEFIEMYPIACGDIILYNQVIKEGLYSRLQKDVQGVRGTEFELTHSSIGLHPLKFPYAQIEVPVVYEANMSMGITEWNDVVNSQYTEFWVYEWIKVPPHVLDECTFDIYHYTDHEIYGYLQILYFAIEAMSKMNPIGKILWDIFGGGDVRRMKNYFPEGIICSELVYLFIKKVAIRMGYTDLLTKCQEWNQDNISPVGVLEIIKAFDGKYFHLKHERQIQ